MNARASPSSVDEVEYVKEDAAQKNYQKPDKDNVPNRRKNIHKKEKVQDLPELT